MTSGRPQFVSLTKARPLKLFQLTTSQKLVYPRVRRVQDEKYASKGHSFISSISSIYIPIADHTAHRKAMPREPTLSGNTASAFWQFPQLIREVVLVTAIKPPVACDQIGNRRVVEQSFCPPSFLNTVPLPETFTLILPSSNTKKDCPCFPDFRQQDGAIASVVLVGIRIRHKVMTRLLISLHPGSLDLLEGPELWRVTTIKGLDPLSPCP